MTYIYAALVALCLVGVGLFLAFRTKQATAKSLIAKTFASLVFVALAVVGLLNAGNIIVKAMFILALVCGLIGDIILDLKIMHPENKKTYFNFGTLMFGTGHILYFIGVFMYLSNLAPAVVSQYWWVALCALGVSVVMAIATVKSAPMLKLDMTGYKWQCGLYSTLLTFMMIISICISFVVPMCWILAAGFTLFLASDLVLSTQYFGGKEQNKKLIVINHVLYYVAQILLASFLFFI